MKIFRYKHGSVAIKTLTVKEFKEALSQYPDDMPVIATWEGQLKAFSAHPDKMAVENVSEPYLHEDEEKCLILDVDY